MRYYLKDIPNKCNISLLTLPKKNTINLILSLEGIIELGNTNYIRKYKCNNTISHILTDNITLIEDSSYFTLDKWYNIPYHHYKITINQDIYKIENIELVISYYNNNIYDYYFIADNFEKINKLRYKLDLLFQ